MVFLLAWHDDTSPGLQIRSTDEVDTKDVQCHGYQHEVVDPLERLGVVSDAEFHRCLDAGCGLDECGVPAFETYIEFFSHEGRAIDDRLTGELVGSYDLRRARAIIEREETIRRDAIRACFPTTTPRIYVFLTYRVEPDGHVTSITIDELSRREHFDVAQCIVSQLADITFPPSVFGDRLEIRDQVRDASE